MSRLRVAVDVRRLHDQPLGGVGRIIANLLPFLAEEVDVVALAYGGRPLPPVPPGVEVRTLAAVPHLPESVWLHTAVSLGLRGFDGVFHGPFNAVPFASRVPSVVSIWDLSFEHHPEGQSWARQRVFSANARYAAKHSARIIVGTEWVGSEIVAAYGVDPARIVVTLCAVDPVFRQHTADELAPVLAGLGLRQPYVAAMGGAPRRGLEVAIAAWQRVRRSRPDLGLAVIAESPPAQPGLTAVGRVDDPTWAAVLAGAEALVYPTRFEGFGMPALEAAASATPVVCAALPPLVEVLGDFGAYAQGTGVDAIAERLDALLGDPAEADRVRAGALARAQAWPTWKDAAAQTVDAYRAAAAEGSRR